MPSAGWNADDVVQLVKLWRDHTQTEIADELGTTRNAVAGKLRRLRVGGSELEHHTPPRGGKKCNGEKVKYLRIRKKAIVEEVKPVVIIPYHAEQPCLLIDLDNHRCRFPIGRINEVDGYEFCGGETLPDMPYCPYHCHIAYVIRR